MRNDGGPAFPGETRIADHVEREQLGMALRDYFAAQAISAFLHVNVEMCGGSLDAAAGQAYAIADAMLAERSKKESD